MALGCGSKLAKALLIIFNIVFWLSGAVVLGVGIWLLVDPTILQTFDIFAAFEGSFSLIKNAAYVLMVVGGIIFLVGFCGCCGAILENRLLLVIYIVALAIIMILELAAGIAAAVFRSKIADEIDEQGKDVFDRCTTGADKDKDVCRSFRQGLNFIQVEFLCCGMNGYEDYRVMGKSEIVATCCILKESSLKKNVANITFDDAANKEGCMGASNTNDIHSVGCIDSIKSWIIGNAKVLIGVGIGIAFIEIFGFVAAICLCRNIGKDE